MAKRKKKTDTETKPNIVDEEEIIKSVTKNISGAEILDPEQLERAGFISTTTLALNYICSGKFLDGGIPLGRVIEIFGPTSSAKTVVATHILKGTQQQGGIAVLIDSESAYSIPFAQALGIDVDKLIYVQPDHLEACFDTIVQTIQQVREINQDKPIVIVYDSIAASPSQKELEEALNLSEMSAEMGLRARVASQRLRTIAGLVSKTKASVIVINQIRSKIGIMYGNPETTAGGGKSLEFYCSVRLDCRGQKQILDSQKRIVGITFRTRCVKNKVAKPFRIAENMELFFDIGINPLSGVLGCALDAGIVKKLNNQGWYCRTDNESIKFQSSLEKNSIPLEWILANADLFGGTEEDVKNFLVANTKQTEDIEIVNDEEESGVEPVIEN